MSERLLDSTVVCLLISHIAILDGGAYIQTLVPPAACLPPPVIPSFSRVDSIVTTSAVLLSGTPVPSPLCLHQAQCLDNSALFLFSFLPGGRMLLASRNACPTSSACKGWLSDVACAWETFPSLLCSLPCLSLGLADFPLCIFSLC